MLRVHFSADCTDTSVFVREVLQCFTTVYVYRRTVSFVDDLVALALTRLQQGNRLQHIESQQVRSLVHDVSRHALAGMGGQAEVLLRVRPSPVVQSDVRSFGPFGLLVGSLHWWGLTWIPLLDLDNMNEEQEQKLYVDFHKAQYSLLHVLSENFSTHEKHNYR